MADDQPKALEGDFQVRDEIAVEAPRPAPPVIPTQDIGDRYAIDIRRPGPPPEPPPVRQPVAHFGPVVSKDVYAGVDPRDPEGRRRAPRERIPTDDLPEPEATMTAADFAELIRKGLVTGKDMAATALGQVTSRLRALRPESRASTGQLPTSSDPAATETPSAPSRTEPPARPSNPSTGEPASRKWGQQ